MTLDHMANVQPCTERCSGRDRPSLWPSDWKQH